MAEPSLRLTRLSANAPCPCGSGRKAKTCCGPILAGQPPATPEALMRSRYTAYATGAVGHLMRTTAPESTSWRADARAWQAELTAYCAAVTFTGLEVFESSSDGDRGEVRFFARLTFEGEDRSFGEHSTFVRRGGRWLYLDRAG